MDRQAVDRDAVGGDQQILPPVDDPGLHQVTALRVHGDSGLRRGHLEFSALDEVGGVEGRVVAELLATPLQEGGHPLLRDRALLQNIPDLPSCNGQGFRVMLLLVPDDLIPQPLMDRLDHLHAAGVLQGVGQGALESLPLLRGEQRRLRMKDRVNELLVDLVGLFGVEQGVVEVGGPVVKGGKEESQLRRGHNLAGDTAVELVLPGKKAQLQLSVLDRADAADDIGEHRVGGVVLRLAVSALVGDVIGVVGQEDQVVAPLHVQGLYHLLIEGLPDRPVLQLGVPQPHEQPVLLAVRHLLGRKHNVDEVPPRGAGQSFLQQAQVLLRLLLGHRAQGLVQIGDDLPIAIDITAVDVADGAPLRAKPAAQLTDLFLVHGHCLALY